jgi:methionyl-tRNA synthetase
MNSRHIYLTTTIPYVNAAPHLGHALEFVQADALARHYRRLGEAVRFQTGTDDNSLKNVLAAGAAGVSVRELVDANAAAFEALAGPLSLSVDDVIRTSSDPRHRAGVERLWQACADAGDLYRRHYEGLYCVGCEAFYTASELDRGVCPDHGIAPQPVAEENWFFRLSRYAERLGDEIRAGRLRIEPAGRRNEVLAFIEAGLADFSVSRSTARAHGWGIPVPGDPGQVIYVWFDALGNYVTALGYGSDDADLGRWWTRSSRRIHLLGKGVLRFHAVYWPAILASAGLPLPTDLLVHDHLTVEGRKISKSGGTTVDPAALVADYGTDAVRWWLLREVPRIGDADFSSERLVARANDELANGIGNLISRVLALVSRYRDRVVPVTECLPPGSGALLGARRNAPALIAAALAVGDFRRATSAVWAIAAEANRYVSQSSPWLLARAELGGNQQAGRELDAILACLVGTCRDLAGQLEPFLPDASQRIAAACGTPGGPAPGGQQLFNRLTLCGTSAG